MVPEDRYVKASRFDLEAQSQNRRVFHRKWVRRPWRALACAIGLGMLSVTVGFNLIDAPQWNRHPLMGWLLGGSTSLFAGYFLRCAILGWRNKQHSAEDTTSTPPKTISRGVDQ